MVETQSDGGVTHVTFNLGMRLMETVMKYAAF
jgi:hypothetical protein